jgi:hypothetical protein
MRHFRRLVALCLVLATAAESWAEEKKTLAAYTGKISSLGIPAAALGPGWTGPTGLVVDDFQNVINCPDELKPVIEELKRSYAPIGVVGCADFTYRKKANPLHQVTLRIFVFDSEESCRDWWKKKYQYAGWENHYTAVQNVPYRALDSAQMTKRAVSFGNVWLTCGTLVQSDDHLKVLDLYVDEFSGHGKEE